MARRFLTLPLARSREPGARPLGPPALLGRAETRGMFRLRVRVLVLCACVAPAAAADAQELRMLATDGLVREAADPNSAAITAVPGGTPLRLIEEMPAWYRIELPPDNDRSAREGYVAMSDVEWIAECGPRQARQLAAGDVFQDCDVGPRMVVIPPGSFTMGSPESESRRYPHEGPQRLVTISQPFAVGMFEVTFDEWDACVRMDGCDFRTADDEGFGRGQRPVLNVNWNEARRYAQWLSDLSGHAYRLLSEAEWEYAARAGSTSVNYWDDLANPCEYMNGLDATGQRAHDFDFELIEIMPCDDSYPGTSPAGSFIPNAFGLYDMIGNADEWTRDCYNTGYSGGPVDGSAWESGLCLFRVSRGGSWFYGLSRNRSANRAQRPPQASVSILGFRVARDLN